MIGPRPPLFPPTTRLLGYCLVVGGLGAGAALAFDLLVDLFQGLLLEGIGNYRPPASGTLHPLLEEPAWSQRWLLPVATTLGGLLSGWLVFRFAPEAEGHGTDAAISSYHRGVEIRARSPWVKMLASALTIGSGGIAGREGPTAQISVGLGAILGRWLGLRGQERRILLLASMAAGLAAIFHAPLGMAIFAVEILYSGMVFESEALIYTVISAVTAYALHGLVAGWEPVFEIPHGLTFTSPAALLGYALLGLLAGGIGAFLPALFYKTQALFRRLPGPQALKPALGGLLVGLVAMAYPGVLGTGYGWVELALAGSLPLGAMAVLLLTKAPAMSLTIGSGGSGGVFGPTVVMGAMLGGIVGQLLGNAFPGLGIEPAAFVVVGMAAVFSGAARTPISTLIMTAEMTGGYGLIVPAMLANVLAFVAQRSLTTGRTPQTLYRSQVENREDSPVHRGIFVRRALEVLEGGELDARDLELPRLMSLLQYGEPVGIGHGGGLLMTLAVAPDSFLAGRSVAETAGPLAGCSIVAVLRDSEMLIPRGPTHFEAGDQVIVVVTPGEEARARRLAEPTAPDPAGGQLAESS